MVEQAFDTFLGDKIEGDKKCEEVSDCSCSSEYEQESSESSSDCVSCATYDDNEMFGYLSHYHVRKSCSRCDFYHFPCYPCYRSRSQFMQIVCNETQYEIISKIRAPWRMDLTFKDLKIVFVCFDVQMMTSTIEDIFPPLSVSVTGIKDLAKFILVVNHMLKYDVEAKEICSGDRPYYLKPIKF